MPTYEYICKNCDYEFEAFQRMADNPLKDCPECESATLQRKIGLGAGIIFKGGGFYETDFKDKKGSKSSDSSSSSSSEKSSSETKSNAKAESAS